MNIITYQFLIFLSIVLPGRITKRNDVIFAIIGWWAYWTLTKVHTPNLIFLQFAVIGLSYLIAVI